MTRINKFLNQFEEKVQQQFQTLLATFQQPKLFYKVSVSFFGLMCQEWNHLRLVGLFPTSENSLVQSVPPSLINHISTTVFSLFVCLNNVIKALL